jgi:signal transduction histidine kinase
MIEIDNPAHLAPDTAGICRSVEFSPESIVEGTPDSPELHALGIALMGPLEKIMRLATRVLNTPAAVISLTCKNKVWYRSPFGITTKSDLMQNWELEFQSLSTVQSGATGLRKPDTCELDVPTVIGCLSVRFYVEVPLIGTKGCQLGTLYLLCSEPRDLGDFEVASLMDIAAIAVDEIELHLSSLPIPLQDACGLRPLPDREMIGVRNPELAATPCKSQHEKEEHYQSLIGLLSDWHWEQDENGCFTLIAETGQMRTPAQFRQYIGKTLHEIPGIWMQEKDWRILNHTTTRREPFQESVFQWRDANNALHYLSVSGQPIFSAEGKFKGYRGVTKDVTEKIRFQEELASSNAALRELSEAQQAFREAERKRIARELHDELAQLLASSRMELCLLQRDLNPASGNHKRLDIVDSLIGSSILSLKKLATDLRPSCLDEGGLYYALRSLLKAVSENAGIECQLLANEEDLTMDELLSTAIFRLVEECLNNIDRHANASRAVVQIYRSENAVEIRVQDDGKGIRPEEIQKMKAFGLMEMRERVRKMRGQIEIRGLPGKGTHIAISLPQT